MAFDQGRRALLTLPAEIRVMILRYVFGDLIYEHDNSPEDIRQQVFTNIKVNLGILGVNRSLRHEALPIFQASLTTLCSYDSDLLQVPPLIRDNTTRVEDGGSFADKLQWYRTRFPRVKSISCWPMTWLKYQHAHISSIEDLRFCLAGNHDEVVIESARYAWTSLDLSLPTNEPPCQVTAKVRAFFGSHLDRTLNLRDLYCLEINTSTGKVTNRFINMAHKEFDFYDQSESDWIPAEQVLMMTEQVAFPVLYHAPTGKKKVLARGADDIKAVEAELEDEKRMALALAAAHRCG